MHIYYDETSIEVIAKVNKLLKARGLWLEDDGEFHDGFIVYKLSEKKFDNDDSTV